MSISHEWRLVAALGLTLAMAVVAVPPISDAAIGGIGPGSAQSKNSRAGAFPVRARHSFGDGLGAGRGHQGQDILARCGRPVVAAKPGRVRFKSYQGGGAGNYVVVRGRGTRYEYVYMHMLRNVRVSRGDFVRAGELIGRVGSTGRSSACHLHFEMWSLPGWYRGGRVFNPTPFLRRLRR
jgi:murein DD-endopeptidase MepM/ murein hydrolase activator NlpD